MEHSNASLQRDSQSDVKERMSPPARQSVTEISKGAEEEDPHRHLVRLEEGLAVTGRQWFRYQKVTQKIGALQTNSQWCWKAPGSTPLNSVRFSCQFFE